MATLATHLNKESELRREAQSLLAFVCRKDLSWLIAHPEYELKPGEEKLYQAKIKKLRTGSPLAYVIGEQDFYNYTFVVTPAVLIPRPESEIIIDEGLKAASGIEAPISFMDLGTGSGALIISLALELKTKQPTLYRRAKFFAGDISAKALIIARSNAKKYRLDKKIIFREGDLLAPFKKDINKLGHGKVFIMANLPYLTPLERRQEPSIASEPTLALIGGRDGLSLYRRLLKSLGKELKSRPFSLLMEINPQQETALINIAQLSAGSACIKKVPDLSGRTRFISISI